MLFRIPEDLKRFRQLTENQSIVMGRKTLDSLPDGKPLPNRRNFVITRNKRFSKADVVGVNSIPQFVTIADVMKRLGSEVYVIGGGEIYKKLLPITNIVLVTKVHTKAKDADTHFPNLDKSKEWKIIEKSDVRKYNDLEYQYITYKRIDR